MISETSARTFIDLVIKGAVKCRQEGCMAGDAVSRSYEHMRILNPEIPPLSQDTLVKITRLILTKVDRPPHIPTAKFASAKGVK